MYPRLRDLRDDRELRQRHLARILGMSQTGYSKYETGACDVPADVLIKLAMFYGTSTDYLLGISDTKTPTNSVRQEQKARRLEYIRNCEKILEDMKEEDRIKKIEKKAKQEQKAKEKKDSKNLTDQS